MSVLPVCPRGLVAELQGALDACAERQRELERSLRVSRRLLRAWRPAQSPAAEPSPDADAGDPPPACTPQELGELELLTQALEKAVRVRKGVSEAGERSKTAGRKPACRAAAPAAVSPVPAGAWGRAGGRPAASRRAPGGGRRAAGPARAPESRAAAAGPRAAKPRPCLGDQHVQPSAEPRTPEVFTLKEKGTQLQLPSDFRKAASLNTRLWTQLSSTSTDDSRDATIAAKSKFLQKLQAAPAGSELNTTEVEAEVVCLREACSMLRLRQEDVLAADPGDQKQEYHRLLTLEGLRDMAAECLSRLQKLQAAVAEREPLPCPDGRPPGAPLPSGGAAAPLGRPQCLLYSSTEELQALAALRLRVDVLRQRVHLQKVLMAELLPLVSRTKPPELALCRAVHSLLCEGGQRFPSVLRDDPDDPEPAH